MRSRRWRSCLQQAEFHPLALALVFSIVQDWQALELTLVGQAVALEALEAAAPAASAADLAAAASWAAALMAASAEAMSPRSRD